MKFWTTSSDAACPDRLMVDMVQCDECMRWIPPINMSLHVLYHRHHDANDHHHQQHGEEDDDSSLPAFVMETVPCEDCRVLVPKDNWAIHRAHVCRGRRGDYHHCPSQPNNKRLVPLPTSSLSPYYENEPPPSLPLLETVECEACGILVPIHNLELHLARACSGIHNGTTTTQVEEEPAQQQQHQLIPVHNVENGDNDNNQLLFEECWECPRCTFQNHELLEESEEDWKCKMCGYSLSTATNEEDPTTTIATTFLDSETKSTQKQNVGKSSSSSSWRNVIKSWVPKEYQQFLPDFCGGGINNKSKKKQKTKKVPKHKQQRRQRRTAAPPSQWEVRTRRSKHLDWLERERQQYLQLLNTTRQEQQALLQQDDSAEVAVKTGTVSLAHYHEEKGDARKQTTPNEANADNTHNNDFQQQPPLLQYGLDLHPQQPQTTQLELLQATEQLCLYHLEHLRRTHLIQELQKDIALLGLPRWRYHLHHLLDLYLSASERYVDNIIWEIRMHFMQYATLECMALLELKIWKEQIIELVEGVPSSLDTMVPEARCACRVNRDISIICQSVLPFLGRPQTPALRAM